MVVLSPGCGSFYVETPYLQPMDLSSSADAPVSIGNLDASDAEAWGLIDGFGWARDFDYKRIGGAVAALADGGVGLAAFARRKVGELREAVDSLREPIETGGDDSTSDLLWHIVGLGRERYLQALANPGVVVASHVEGDYGTRCGYVESFAYAFH